MGIQKRLAASQAFVPSTSNVRFRLPTDNVVVKTGVHLYGTFTIATQDATAVNEDGFRHLISNIRMLIDGKYQILSGMDFDLLIRQSDKWEGITGARQNSPAVGQATYNVDLLAWFHHAIPGLRGQPHAGRATTELDVRGRQSVEMIMDFAALSQAATPDASTVLSEALTVDVIQQENTNPLPPAAGYSTRILEQQYEPVTAAGVLDDDIRDGNYLRSVFEVVRNNSVRSDALVTNVQLRIQRAGVRLLPEDRGWDNVQADAEQRMGIAMATGETMILLDPDNTGRDVEDLSTTTEAKLRPTVGTPTATASITRCLERITQPGVMPNSGM